MSPNSHPYTRKSFPSTVNWRAVWRHRWLILELINQITWGDVALARHIAVYVGGYERFGDELLAASREIIVGSRHG